MQKLNLDKRGIRLTRDLLSSFQNSVEKELNKRTLEFCSPGILDSSSPTTPTTTSPLFVILDTGFVRIYPGTILFSSGELYTWEGVTELTLPSTLGDYYLVARVNTEEVGAQLTRYSETVHPILNEMGDFYFAVKNTYALLNNHEVIAELNYDFATSSWLILFESENLNIRRWGSSKDSEHRAQIGTGKVTGTNPHGTSFNDLTLANDIFFWDLVTGNCVVTGNTEVRHFIGALVTQVIPPTEFSNQGTYKSTNLQYFPLTVISIKESGVEKLVQFTPGSKIIKFRTSVTDAITVIYLVAFAGMLDKDQGSSTKLLILEPYGKELLISGGNAVTFATHTTDLREYVKFALDIAVLVDSTGKTFLNPNQVLEPTYISDIQGSSTGLMQNLTFPSAKLLLGLADSNVFSGTLSIRVTGLGSDGQSLNEDIIFDGTWQPPSSSQVGYYSPQYKYTNNYFTTISKVEVLAVTGTGPAIGTVLSIFTDQIDPVGLRLGTLYTKPEVGISTIVDQRNIVSLYSRRKFQVPQDAILYDDMANPLLGSTNCFWNINEVLLTKGSYKSKSLVVSDAGSAPYLLIEIDNGFTPSDVLVNMTINNVTQVCPIIDFPQQGSSPFVSRRNRYVKFSVPSGFISQLNMSVDFILEIISTSTRVVGFALVRAN